MKVNLLPPTAKTELFYEEIKKLIIILGALVLSFLISLILILFGVKTYISGQQISYQAMLDLEKERAQASEIKNLKEKIKTANKDLSDLKSFYEEQADLTEILEKISEILLPKMYLTNFSYQKGTSKVMLSGFAPDRDTLREFKNNLEKVFPEPYFPTEIWAKKTNIDFQVTFRIR